MKYFLIFSILLLGCYNNPTPPSEITGAMVSGVLYKQLDCEALNEEIIFLEGQGKRISYATKISNFRKQISAGLGKRKLGKVDGVEASELHQVKGQIFAARKVFQNKGYM